MNVRPKCCADSSRRFGNNSLLVAQQQESPAHHEYLKFIQYLLRYFSLGQRGGSADQQTDTIQPHKISLEQPYLASKNVLFLKTPTVYSDMPGAKLRH